MSSQMWYRALLSHDEIAAGYVAAIRQQFADAVKAAGEPDGACLFVTSQAETRERGKDTDGDAPVDADAVFFSPASVSAVPRLIARYSARPSAPPDRACAALLVGKPLDWDLLPRATH